MNDWALRTVVVFCVALILFASAATGILLYQVFTNGHQFRKDQERVWHDVLCAIEAEVPRAPKTTAEQRKKAILFYDRLLVLANAAPCPD